MDRLEKYEIDLIREASVFPPKYRNNIVRILESNERTEDLFVEELHALISQDRMEFVETLFSVIRTRTVDHYYNSRYIKPRQTKTSQLPNESPLEYNIRFIDSFSEPLQYLFKKEYDLAVAHSPEQQRLLENNPQVFVEYLEPGDFPQTDIWIERKRIELQNLIPELQKVEKGLMQFSFSDRPTPVILNPEEYTAFPAGLATHQNLPFDISDLRIKGFKSYGQITSTLSDSLGKFSSRFGQENMKAFIFNSFDFPENNTRPALLELVSNENISKNSVVKHVRKIADEAKDREDIKLKNFTKSLFLNFGCCRKKDSDLKTQLMNLRSDLSKVKERKK